MTIETDSPLVSVIVPIYNVENYLNQCIASICAQTYGNLQILLIDDGSTDDCPGICDRWATKDSRVQVIHQGNGGLSVARNTGIRNATGLFVLFVDSDDWIEPNLVKNTVTAVHDEKIEVVIFRYRFVSEDGKSFSESRDAALYPRQSELNAEEAVRDNLTLNLPNYAWSYMMSRDLLRRENIYFPEGRLMEDMATTYRIWGAAQQVVLLHDIYYNYRIRQGSILTTKNERRISDVEKTLDEIQLYINRRFPQLWHQEYNMSIRILISLKITAYEWKKAFSNDWYRTVSKRLDRRINRRVKQCGLTALDRISFIKLILSTRFSLPVIATVSAYRNRIRKV